MNNGNTDLATMLDELNLPLAAERLTEILSSPELGNYSPQQLLREVIEPQYIESMKAATASWTESAEDSPLVTRSILNGCKQSV